MIQGGYEVEMNWNIGHYLPEDASCQEIFKVIIAGHIRAIYEKLQEIQQFHDTGGIQRIDTSQVAMMSFTIALQSHKNNPVIVILQIPFGNYTCFLLIIM